MDGNPYLVLGQALSSALGRLRDRYADMTLLQAQALLLVAGNPGISQIAIARTLEMTDGTASRTFAILADIGNARTGAPGLDFIRMDVNPKDRRERLLTLTHKGKRMMDDILSDLKPVRR